ncbi:spore germination protein [Anaerobacillus sp. HL2]|nr:spore germination protein [Anaerobacillus sp. HL2]
MSTEIYNNLSNISKIMSDLGNSPDVIVRYINVNKHVKIGLVYIDGLTNKELIEFSIIEALLS